MGSPAAIADGVQTDRAIFPSSPAARLPVSAAVRRVDALAGSEHTVLGSQRPALPGLRKAPDRVHRHVQGDQCRPEACSSPAGDPEDLPASQCPGLRGCLLATAALCSAFAIGQGFTPPAATTTRSYKHLPAAVGKHRCPLVDTRRRSRVDPQVSREFLLCLASRMKDFPLRNPLMLLENGGSLEF